MYILFIPTAVALIFALVISVAPIFEYDRSLPMLEQIELERWNSHREAMEAGFPYEEELI
jgi:hypothetical protein